MADEVEIQDAAADSSSASADQTTPPAGAPNTDAAQQPGPPKEQSIPYPRFKEVNDRGKAYQELSGRQQQEIQRLQAELQGLQQKAQAQSQQLSPQDKQTYEQAYSAIEQILMTSPRGQKLLQMADQADQHQGVQQTVRSIQEAQLRALEQQGVQRIFKIADDENLPKDEESRGVLIQLVQAMALQIPNAAQRFRQGDMSLFSEAFEKAKPFLAHVKREGQTQLLDTKTRTRQLPPASRGSAAGPPGLPKMDPANPRAFTEALHKMATERLGTA